MRKFLLGAAAVFTFAWCGMAIADYTATQGAGTNFASLVAAGPLHFAKMLICDQSAGATCASVGTAGSPSTNAVTVQAVTLGHGTAANAIRVELPTDGTGIVGAAQSGTWNIATVTNLAGQTGWGGGTLGAMANYGTSPGAVLVPGVNAFITNTAAVNATTWAGGVLGAMANYGTSPGAVLVPGVNAFVTNANANGQATSANSSPVVLPAVQVSVGATASAPPANADYIGANASGATGGVLKGLVTCDSHVFKHITSATDTLAVQGVASQTIYICAWRSRAAGVATWFLENTASTNANCASANTQITGVATEAANTGETFSSPFWHGLKNTSGNGLCINSTGTGGVDIDIWYAQF